MKTANSNNHNEDGQNVLYADGHVEFQQNPFVGIDRDNVFTARTGEKPDPKTELIVAWPYDGKDSILLPTDD
jgi:prepilin-type processing-associated H-X9-DG protein